MLNTTKKLAINYLKDLVTLATEIRTSDRFEYVVFNNTARDPPKQSKTFVRPVTTTNPKLLNYFLNLKNQILLEI